VKAASLGRRGIHPLIELLLQLSETITLPPRVLRLPVVHHFPPSLATQLWTQSRREGDTTGRRCSGNLHSGPIGWGPEFANYPFQWRAPCRDRGKAAPDRCAWARRERGKDACLLYDAPAACPSLSSRCVFKMCLQDVSSRLAFKSLPLSPHYRTSAGCRA
jgi:hypothetical protein